MRTLGGIVAIVLTGSSLASAGESKPIEQLPSDVARWSTLWLVVPEGISDVRDDYGPAAAMTWGPAWGAVALMKTATKELWDASQPDKREGHKPTSKTPAGPLLRYEF